MTLTVTDLFCGAGGSSTGAIRVPGVEVKLALNHWDKAIETHQRNHPTAAHDLADLFEVHPSRYQGYATDILVASPECRKHSRASLSVKSTRQQRMFVDCDYRPDEVRSRATMWQVVYWAEQFHYRAILLENVTEAREWAEFDDWYRAMHNLGYEGTLLSLNSQFFGVPQSRDRLYGVFWRRGEQAPDVQLRPLAHCPRHGDVQAIQSWKRPTRQYGAYGAHGQYWYRCPHCASVVHPTLTPAATILDWSLPAPRIGERAHPLAEKTRARIQEGIRRWWATHQGDPAPAYLQAHYSGDHPLHAVTTEPTGTITTADHHAVLTPPPLLYKWFMTQRAYPLSEPVHTVTAGGHHHFLAIPPLLVKRDRSDAVYPASAHPAHTVTAGGNHHFLAIPPMLVPYHATAATTDSITEPVGTLTTRDRYGLVTPDPGADLDDWGFRMLATHEIQAAMAFPGSYQLVGTRKDQTRLLGNAVTPPVMQWLISRVAAALEPMKGPTP